MIFSFPGAEFSITPARRIPLLEKRSLGEDTFGLNEIHLTEEAAPLEVLLAPEGGPLSVLSNGSTVTTNGTPARVNLGSCGI